MHNRWFAGGFSLALLGAVLWPVVENWRRAPRDNFPFSYYPMFSARRGKRVRVTYMLGIDSAGRRVPIAHRTIGPGGLNQVRRQLRRIVASGRAEALCRDVAARAARAHSNLVTLRLVTGTYELDRYFAGDRHPHAEVIHAEVGCSATVPVGKEV